MQKWSCWIVGYVYIHLTENDGLFSKTVILVDTATNNKYKFLLMCTFFYT